MLNEFYSDGAAVKSNEADERIVQYNIIYNVGSKVDVKNESIRPAKGKKKISNHKILNEIFRLHKKKEINHSNIISFIRIFINNDLAFPVSFNLKIKLDVFISKSFSFSSELLRIICFFRFTLGFL
jgi:hypothetical protein